jgi:uncharacterized protein (TIGR02145 family)
MVKIILLVKYESKNNFFNLKIKKMKKYSLLLLSIVALFAISCKKETTAEKEPGKIWALYDKSGNGYDTIKIGTQFWMKQNLNTTHYRNGDLIPNVTDPTAWSSIFIGAWCWYNNDSATYAATYGKLYNYYALIDSRGLAPEGWHIPNNTEWDYLKTFYGGGLYAGGALKEAGNAHWLSNNTATTNSSRFTALPGGKRYNGSFLSQGIECYLWTSTLRFGTTPQCIFFDSINPNAMQYFGGFTFTTGFNIRCIKD